MRVIDKVMALLDGLTPEDIAALPPAHRERFAAICKACGQLAERLPNEPKPKAGILSALKNGDRGE